MTQQEKPSSFYLILNDIAELLTIKNKKYGNSYDKTRSEWGEIAFALRLEDKFNRVKTLIKNKDAGTSDESLEDTIKDIIGYCTLELRYRQEHS